MTIPTAPPPPADHAAPGVGSPAQAVPQGAERFLLWVAGLGVARSEGWLGGVSAGIAARLRIDPLIVRGVLVVAALFGLPVIFLYAVAWALLPDLDGHVHARALLRRDYQPVQLGILGMAIIGLIPTAPLTGRLFGFGYESWSALALFGWIVGLVVVGGLLFLIVRAASRTPGASAPDLPMASADQAAPAASVPLAGSGTAEGADATFDASLPAPGGTAAAGATPDAPPAPPAPLPAGVQDPADIAAWRAQHTAWKEQDQAWRRRQQDAERAVRDQLRRERQASAAAFALEAAERRRIRRASNPRAGFAVVASVLGLAIVTGAAVGLWSGGDGVGGALGLLSAALVLALGMIVAGAFRRRSGFLAFATVLTLVSGLVAGGVSAFQGVAFGWASISNNQAQHLRQPFGELSISLHQHDDAPRPIVVEKGSGTTWISVDPGVQLQLHATGDNVDVSWMRVEAETGTIIDTGMWTPTERGGDSVVSEAISAENGTTTTVQRVTIDQTSGDVSVTIIEPEKEDER
ncbi:PspC domain-containing protein [Microbacterium sp. W4I20]|uniref:PspC domain-containing protein n=1 Tax=Microbacterium sp. W4I20 TaxID=3042262 RepID=UPI00278AB964|nr:PspC domain-containing protein [Microbacterium sp. W4I20]MDQ0728391.1 phage shock protein PspC (stress-responsive transcriptional regulator) [Microbacterium sp. W4I20]